MATIRFLACLVLSVGLKHFSTFLLHLIKTHSDAARDGAIALSIALILSLLYILLPPPALTDSLADGVESSVNAFLFPLYRFNATLNHVTIALRRGAHEQDANTQIYPAPIATWTLMPLSPLIWLLERVAALPREPARFVAFVITSSTVTIPLVGPNLVLALLKTAENAYVKQVAAVLEIPILLAVAALLFLQLRFAMRIFSAAREISNEKDPRRRADMVEECMNILPSLWDWGSWEMCWRE